MYNAANAHITRKSWRLMKTKLSFFSEKWPNWIYVSWKVTWLTLRGLRRAATKKILVYALWLFIIIILLVLLTISFQDSDEKQNGKTRRRVEIGLIWNKDINLYNGQEITAKVDIVLWTIIEKYYSCMSGNYIKISF